MPQNEGDTIQWRRFASLSAATTALTEGTTPAGSALSIATITATVAQYGDFVEISDKLDMLGIDPVLTETAELLGEQAALTIDTLVRDVIVAGTSVQYAAGRASRATVAAGDVFNITELRKAVRTLSSNNARKIDGGYVAIVHPKTVYDIQNDSAWVNAAQYAGSTRIFNGEVGKLYGVRFVESSNAKVFTGAGASGIDVYATLIFGNEFYGVVDVSGVGDVEFIVKPHGSAGTADPLNQRATSGWKTMFVSKILQDLAAVRVEHAVS